MPASRHAATDVEHLVLPATRGFGPDLVLVSAATTPIATSRSPTAGFIILNKIKQAVRKVDF